MRWGQLKLVGYMVNRGQRIILAIAQFVERRPQHGAEHPDIGHGCAFHLFRFHR
jgi:hypothetical protein